MDNKRLNEIFKNRNELERQIRFFIGKKVLFDNRFDKFEIQGHLKKAKHNLNFIRDNFKLGYNDWVIVGCYYAVYHSVLGLILSKGYFSKNHDATLCVLIKEFYKEFDDEIKFVNNLFISYSDVSFYVQSKNKRELASYSSSFVISKKEAENTIKRSIDFVNKVEEILNEQDF